MCSQRVWEIEELVHLICSHTLQYKGKVHWQKDGDLAIYNNLKLNPKSRNTLAQCAILNHSISRIATKVLWRELNSFEPLIALLPRDYYGLDKHGWVSGLYRCTHWIKFELLDTIVIRVGEGRHARGF